MGAHLSTHALTHAHAASIPGWPRSLGSRRAWKGVTAREWDLTEGSEGPPSPRCFPSRVLSTLTWSGERPWGTEKGLALSTG